MNTTPGCGILFIFASSGVHSGLPSGRRSSPLYWPIPLLTPWRERPNAGRLCSLLLSVIPFWTNFLIRTYAWMVILRSNGLINAVLSSLGLIDQPLSLLFTPGAVLLGLVYGFLPFMILPIYAAIDRLEPSLLEASSDLGARPWQTFWRVTLPLTAPGIAAGVLLVFVPALGMFVIPDLMGGAKVSLIGNLIQNQFLGARNWQFGSAASVVLMALVVLGLRLYKRFFRLEGVF